MKCNLTSNLHQIYSSILQNYHNPCIFDLKTCFVFKQHFFFKTHGFFQKICPCSKNIQKYHQTIVFFQIISNTYFLGEIFHFYVKETDGWKARSHATQLGQLFPSDTFEIYKGPSD